MCVIVGAEGSVAVVVVFRFDAMVCAIIVVSATVCVIVVEV